MHTGWLTILLKERGFHLEAGEARKAAHSRPTGGSLCEVDFKDGVEKANMSVMWRLEFGCEDRCATRRCDVRNKEELWLLRGKCGYWDGKNEPSRVKDAARGTWRCCR